MVFRLDAGEEICSNFLTDYYYRLLIVVSPVYNYCTSCKGSENTKIHGGIFLPQHFSTIKFGLQVVTIWLVVLLGESVGLVLFYIFMGMILFISIQRCRGLCM